MKTSELLRSLILAEIDTPSTPAPVMPSPEKSDLSQMTVRVPAFLSEAIRERAAARGMAVGRWVASLIQSNVVAHPVLTNEEILAVLSVQRELNAVGRNVNQIARHLNENFMKQSESD